LWRNTHVEGRITWKFAGNVCKTIKIILLDGGFGRELHFRGVDVPSSIWSAGALISDPDVVRQIHADYIAAGADVITTNTYGLIRSDLVKEELKSVFQN